ncbi:LysR family transcriptional regulator [Legionella sp. W05-934-2]|jgi:DNA-binding transcriptional LysR family regulator|uniref:LysR family transcriptional regulator n=1 Tax=Legionella sp. W05-934-2 TaxID=1198649 RepID=UPI0034617C82
MINFTLRQLEIFLAAATYSSFSLAAKYLHMSKPAITKQIQVLESQLNLKLFRKYGRGMRLTPQAKELLPQVKLILEEANNMKKRVSLGFEHTKPVLKFSTGHTYSGILFKAMKHFSKFEEVEYEVFVEPKDRGYKRVEQGKVNFLVTGVKIDDPDLVFVPFFNIHFFLVGAKANASIPQGKISVQDIKHLPFIQIKAEPHQTVLQTKNDFVKRHFSKIIQLESYYSIKEAIKAGFGVGVLPETLLHDDMDKFHILPINTLQFQRQIYLITSKEELAIKDKFINYIQTDFKIEHMLD